ncbi:MAG: Ig-like domain-containing protein [Gemmatimonadaceae bacterium]
MRTLVIGLCFTGAALIVAACSKDDHSTTEGCGPIVNGVVVSAPGIDLQVRDPYGRAQAIGTTAVVHPNVASNVNDTLNILTAYNVTGTFTVTLSRRYYLDATLSPITVTPNGCVVNSVKVPVVLQLAPGAPKLRALVVVGVDFLGQPGAQAHLVAHFDADPDASQAVTWTVSDATLATVDANGVVTAKCSKSGGTITVTATSVADPTLTSTVTLGVAPATTCP